LIRDIEPESKTLNQDEWEKQSGQIASSPCSESRRVSAEAMAGKKREAKWRRDVTEQDHNSFL
jgi:hypothetical protein